ncbi:hypothetical protein Athai_29460 [Actinocatenispora thailandica]|uniref:Uncharacterized protein n=1 Tax=Actinocatenispora thailandica TaxID=227318 RepID=A0A7R7DPJ6_9ACTN|nr:hypothetical protein [Actinocatenispora thailandica]BCJ35443.1 hypothetical protein Athai_29460 [Actinocatenispora thailandica]
MDVRQHVADRLAGHEGPLRSLGLVRALDGGRNMQLMVLAGIVTVLVTRAYLAATGYPQVGGGSLHIAHALWGGLLMLIGLVVALLFADRAARLVTAIAGGVGLGLFVDEVGKFITRTNDYFFAPAAGVMYLLFAALVLLVMQVRIRRRGGPAADAAAAAVLAAGGLTGGLTGRQRSEAMQLVAGREDAAAVGVRYLIAAAPSRSELRPGAGRFGALRRRVRRIADWRFLPPILIGVLSVTRLIVAVVFVVQTIVALAADERSLLGQEYGAVFASALTRTAEAVLSVLGALRWRRNRTAAYRLLLAALYLNLFVTQLFNFTDSQFGALADLPSVLVMLGLLTYWRRRDAAA